MSAIRTCIGCREVDDRSALLRIIVDPDSPATVRGDSGPVRVVVDERGAAPGRGAWVHPRTACLELAERRRAFGRAFRQRGEVDAYPVRCWFAEHVQPSGLTGTRKNAVGETRTPAATHDSSNMKAG